VTGPNRPRPPQAGGRPPEGPSGPVGPFVDTALQPATPAVPPGQRLVGVTVHFYVPDSVTDVLVEDAVSALTADLDDTLAASDLTSRTVIAARRT
jgi:hypothetical protein